MTCATTTLLAASQRVEPRHSSLRRQSPGHRLPVRVTWAVPCEQQRPAAKTLPPLLPADLATAAGRHLPSPMDSRGLPALTFADIHRVRPPTAAAAATLEAARRGNDWRTVASTFLGAARQEALSDSRSSWTQYLDACLASGTPPTPVSTLSMTVFWTRRVIGFGRKSSGLQSTTSRILSHAKLLGQSGAHNDGSVRTHDCPFMPQRLAGHAVPIQTQTEIWGLLPRFCKAFPCEIKPAAPPLGRNHGLDTAIAYATSRAAHSLFFRSMTALLCMMKALYCRPSALLEGNLRLADLSFVPPSDRHQGGIVVNLLLPKKRKEAIDRRRDSHPIPTGRATQAILSLLDARGLLRPGASPDAIIFPDIHPITDTITSPKLSVSRSSDVLRQFVFGPARLPLAHRLTLRGIRSGASTDAHADGVSTTSRLAQGGWKTERGAATYLDISLATLTSPPPSGPGR
jgi:hypothetical protein